jgi:hypothetical protein
MPQTPGWWNAALVVAGVILVVGVLALIALGLALFELVHLFDGLGAPD